jgi:lantibiotic modifying enzyme
MAAGLADLTRADRYTQVATAAGEWVKNAAVSAEGGRAWPTVAGKPERVDPSLLGAEAGVILFLIDLWRTTGSPEAAAAVVDAVRRVGVLAASTDRWGLYDGLSGMALSAARAAEALGDDDLAAIAASLVDQLLRGARPTPANGLEWPALPAPDGRGPWNELYRGLAGIGLVLLELDHRDEAAACGNRLVHLALRGDIGHWWRSRPDDHKPAPNIAHGTTGIAYFVATLGMETGEERYGQMALDGAVYLLSIARTDVDTCAVHHHEGDGRDLYTLGWCSGPPGLGCLFVRLHQLTADRAWLTWAERAARTVTTSGLPSRLYPGFWDNVGHCCGSAGVADFIWVWLRRPTTASGATSPTSCSTTSVTEP